MEALRKHKWILMIALVIVSFSVALKTSAHSGEGEVTCAAATCISISGEDCEIREGLETDSPVIATASQDQVFQVVSRFCCTLGIQMDDGRVGYISLDNAELFESDAGKAKWNTDSSIAGISFDGAGEIDSRAYFLEPGNKPEEVKEEEQVEKTHGNPPAEESAEMVADADIEQISRNSEKTTSDPKTTSETVITYETEKPEEEAIDSVQQEKIMYSLINSFRTSKGLCSLAQDTLLEDIARTKSTEMVDKDYFSHTSPTYGAPGEMLEYFDVNYSYMGENLAYDRNAEAAFEAFKCSEVHRVILLNPEFRYIGVGVSVDEKNMIMVTAFLIDKP